MSVNVYSMAIVRKPNTGGGGVPVVRTYNNPAVFSFEDGLGNPITLDAISIVIIDYGGHVGEILASINFGAHVWLANGFAIASTIFPSDPIYDLVVVPSVSTVGQCTSAVSGDLLACQFSTSPNVLFMGTLDTTAAPNNAVSAWSGQAGFIYT